MERETVPHVLLFPFPVQSHINTMLRLAELLCLAGFNVTFLNTEHNYQRLLRFSDVHTRFTRWPGFCFKTISDGLPADHPRSVELLNDIFFSLKTITKPLFREMLISGVRKSDSTPQPVTCIIADGVMSFTIDVAEELGIPVISFRLVSACCIWACFCIPKLIEVGEVPFQDEDMDLPITYVPGMESILRRRDLPSYCRVKDQADPFLQRAMTETLNITRASALILNTLEELEGPTLERIRSHCPKIYTIGPLHALLESHFADSSSTVSSNSSLWEEDRSCMTWLDSQPLKSVLYVSFGSLTVTTRVELFEIWYGLVNSGKRFLWVIRQDSIIGKGEDRQIPADLEEGTKERGRMVLWAPQMEVLAHPAVGGFMTHSGWTSTLESIYAGVPMICWPYFADQQINSRFVSEVWKIGLDMKDTCDRLTVEKMVRDLMEGKKEEFTRSADKQVEMLKRSVSKGGSSYCNFERLIEDIKSITVRAPHT